jgi:hypothetical protein
VTEKFTTVVVVEALVVVLEGANVVVVEREMVVGDVDEEPSVLVDIARVVDVLRAAVVDEEPPPPQAPRRTRPATTIVLRLRRATRLLLIRYSLRTGELPGNKIHQDSNLPC